eukprot:TRINITY_DN1939_c0_g2_i1.p1 TRINITY_DN1939_c0_g2~~TRINITY_DN1939_c0_g2_i1.p1  ORF type:complete len:279 (-),score=30.83 TRINITY_DN1939_c0_g2_i1:1055-1891(-)
MMVQFLQQIRGGETPKLDGYQLIRNEQQIEVLNLEKQVSSTSHVFSQGSPRIMSFDQMATFIHGISLEELNTWNSPKIWKFLKYLVDRLQNSIAYRGYFQCMLQLVEVFVNYMKELNMSGGRLPRGQQRQDLVIALMCIQALNKAYGRRSDIRASCYILAERVASNFTTVANMFQNAVTNIDASIQLPRVNFVIPRDSRRVLSALLEITSSPSKNKPTGILVILDRYGVRPGDFKEADVEWLESEQSGANQEHMYEMSGMLQWLLYVLRPERYPQPSI